LGTNPHRELPRKLGALDAASIVVGVVIGSGIFLTPPEVARSLGSKNLILGVWIVTGLLSFCGALALAELGATMPATGGQYVYLREAYGPLWAFLYGWITFLVIWTGGTAAIAVGFSLYLAYFVPLTATEGKLVSVALVAALTAVHYRGVRLGAGVQNALNALKLAGIAILVGGAFLSGAAPAGTSPAAAAAFSWSQFGGAMVACLFTYEGWNAVSFMAGEIREPHRNLPLGLGLGMVVIIAVYTLVNAAALRVLSVAEIAASDRLGALIAERSIGPQGAALVTATILLAIAGSTNGCLMTGPRVYFSQARDGLFFRRFTAIHPRFETPAFSIALQGVVTAVFSLSGSYELLLSYSVFGSWVFYLLTVGAVVVLRVRQPGRERPYRMWGYPATPLVFCVVALAFLVNTVVTRPLPSLAALGLMAAGVPLYYYWRGKGPAHG